MPPTPTRACCPSPVAGWGRGQETNGEDPVLTSALTSALIHGLQDGDDPRYKKLVATSKHWLGYHLESWAGDAQYRLSHRCVRACVHARRAPVARRSARRAPPRLRRD